MSGVSGKYRLDQRLGGGGMAEVFLGSTVGAEGFSRKVAIKRVLPGYSDNEAFAKMFVAEAQITSQLQHPNIVSVLDFDRDPENRLFLVMELVEGKDLDQLTSTGLLPFPVVIFVISEVLRGLGHAHDLPVGNQSRGVVHRDISPHNVLLSWAGAVKVSDFGIAKARAASEATASVFIKGKPAYMSPEQANGQSLDGRSDLFAVGIMLWEMLVGRRLFVAEDTRATLAAVLFGQIPRPRSLRGDVPKDLERVCMKLLERDLPARYATAEEAVHELLECTDAPKAGREVLVAALAERFVGQAPVRQSLIRQQQQMGYGATTPVLAMGQPIEPTPPQPAAALSLGSMRNAPTGTIDLPRKRGSLIMIVVIVAVVSAVLAFAIGLAVKGGSKADPGSGSTVATTGSAPPDAAPAPPPPPVDAAPVVVADAQIPTPDAPSPPDPKKDAPKVRVAEKRYGTLKVVSDPPAQFFIGGKSYGWTPSKEIKLPVGPVTVTFSNPDANINNQVRTTNVVENQTIELRR